MCAYTAVLAHPYFAVTDREGAFLFASDGRPDGTYLVRRWHPEVGETEAMSR